MKKTMCLLLILMLAAVIFSACFVEQTQSQVEIVLPVDGVPLYTKARIFVEQTQLPLHNVKVNNWYKWSANVTNRGDCGVGFFTLLGNAAVTVEFDFQLDQNTVVRPVSAGVDVQIAGNSATFTISSAGYYSIEPNGDPLQAIFLFVSDFDSKDYTVGYSNIIVFERGIHTAQNNQHINSSNAINIPSNTVVVLHEGAVVKARLESTNTNNIAVVGRGIVDGSDFVRNANTGERLIPLDFNYCSDILIKDISFFDPAGWCLNLYFCNNAQIDGVKIISSRSNGDGITLQSCQNVSSTNFFVRSFDDSVVVKNYPKWHNRAEEGQTENITFANGVIWTDLAQSMEVGYETVGQKMQNITFENITVLHNFHKPVMSIHNGNNANIKNVEYKGITVEDASMGKGDAGTNCQLIDVNVLHNKTWSDQHKITAMGSVSDIRFSNIKVVFGTVAQIELRFVGSIEKRSAFDNTTHYVENVTISDIEVYGQKLQPNFAGLLANSCTRNIAIVNTNAKVTGAEFVFSQTAAGRKNYTQNAVVTAK